MRTATHRSVGQVLTDDEGREFDLPIIDTYGDPSWTALVDDLPDGRVLVSYLVVDEGRTDLNPAEQECWGWDWVVLESQRDADALSERLNACDICGEYRDTHTLEYFEPDDLHEWVNADSAATHDGRAFFFEKYEHGAVIYALRGESSQVDRQWDVTPIAGWMKAQEDLIPTEEYSIEYMARESLAEYTSWCNGDIYGIVHAVYIHMPTHGREHAVEDDPWECVEDEACWGYIGSEYAETEMKAEHQARLNA